MSEELLTREMSQVAPELTGANAAYGVTVEPAAGRWCCVELQLTVVMVFRVTELLALMTILHGTAPG